MKHGLTTRRIRAVAATLALAGVALLLTAADDDAVRAQSIMRSPNLNIESRIPSIGPNISGAALDRINPRVDRVCSYRNSAGECATPPTLSVDNGGNSSAGKGRTSAPRRNAVQTTVALRYVANELVAEIDGALTDVQADALARRHGLVRVGSQSFPLIGATVGLFRIVNGRALDAARSELTADASVRSVQPNFRYVLQDQTPAVREGDPAQYALAKLRLPQAHALARGAGVTIAVIDSGIDVKHPELADAIAGTFDALGTRDGGARGGSRAADSKESADLHGTGIAGAIVAHARLMGSAPAAKILAIRAFGARPDGTESTSFVILKGLDYAAAHGAQIVNMSFSGPNDALIERGIGAIAAKGIVMVAAAGNAGPKSPPLFPAANPNVIAVSATDAQDNVFAASNRGSYIALAAPGVDIFLPARDGKYQMTSGTSFSAAYVSGIAALMLERDTALKADAVLKTLTATARDLGPPGRDDLFGAGEADAFAAVSAVTPATTAPAERAAEIVSDRQQVPATSR